MAGGRIRTIKPELLEDEKIGALSSDQFRLFIGLILLADDHGNFRANAVWLNGQIFWGQTLASPREPVANTRECIRALADVGLILLYSDDSQQYGHITNWLKHQRIDHPSSPKLPLPTAENIEKKGNVGQPRETPREPREPSEKILLGSGSGSGMDLDGKGLATGQPAAVEAKPEPVIDQPKPPKPERPKKPFTLMTGREQVIETYFAEYERARGEKPPFGPREAKSADKLIGVLKGDHGRAMAVLRNAYADTYWQGKATINTIANEPAKFDGQVLQFDRKKPVVQSGGWQMDEEENQRKLKEMGIE